ncbi:hypothetical protein [Nostoc parmelioides]|uniref:Uncharacterized protein n=1 Tax=Nostoc parmelioides FACHB-3921 TaxID=2692909 RepID=A0ABR8BND1_9NOSO|nr:hypothetical protein [Nostoc parmelioides]MBD2255453.1 hypothetical protein [Nostoc parmelioides FACHB-3921]
MQPTISIPKGWDYPKFTLGQRIKQGLIIGIQYYPTDTLLAHEYGTGWRYTVMSDKNSEEVRSYFDDQIQQFSVAELQAQLQAELEEHQQQITALQEQLGGLTDVYISLIELVKASQYLISKIAKHPDFLALRYHPDLSIGDAQTALSYLKDELETNQQSANTAKTCD